MPQEGTKETQHPEIRIPLKREEGSLVIVSERQRQQVLKVLGESEETKIISAPKGKLFLLISPEEETHTVQVQKITVRAELQKVLLEGAEDPSGEPMNLRMVFFAQSTQKPDTVPELTSAVSQETPLSLPALETTSKQFRVVELSLRAALAEAVQQNNTGASSLAAFLLPKFQGWKQHLPLKHQLGLLSQLPDQSLVLDLIGKLLRDTAVDEAQAKHQTAVRTFCEAVAKSDSAAARWMKKLLELLPAPEAATEAGVTKVVSGSVQVSFQRARLLLASNAQAKVDHAMRLIDDLTNNVIAIRIAGNSAEREALAEIDAILQKAGKTTKEGGGKSADAAEARVRKALLSRPQQESHSLQNKVADCHKKADEIAKSRDEKLKEK